VAVELLGPVGVGVLQLGGLVIQLWKVSSESSSSPSCATCRHLRDFDFAEGGAVPGFTSASLLAAITRETTAVSSAGSKT